MSKPTLNCCLLTALAGLVVAAAASASAVAAETKAESDFYVRWAEKCFSETARTAPAGNRLLLVREEAAGDTKVGRCTAGTPLRLGEKTYTRGIGINSHSVLRVVLTKPAARFVADVGLDRNVDGTVASVVFHVAVAGKDVFTTKVLRPADGLQKIDVPLGGARQFDLIVDNGGDDRSYDQGDWADARVILEDGTEVWLDDLPGHQQADSGVPFSFWYGGRHSSELLAKWNRTVTSESIDANRQRRILTLTDPETGLEVRAEATVYLDTPSVEWTLYFTNKGQKDTPILENVKAVDATVATGVSEGPKLLRLVGSPCRVDDWLPLEDPVPPGKRIAFATVGGRSSSGASPFFNLQWPGGGVITAIGWSGQWAANVQCTKDGTVNLSAGMETTHLKLHPGETIRSPRIMQLYWTGDDPWRGYNQFRRVMFAQIMPRIDGQLVVPPIAHLSTSYDELNDSTEANVLSHLEAIKGLGFEVFWLDAYWILGGFGGGVGHYGFPIERVEPKDRFPRGIRPISDAAHREGMKFLLWFEPERVNAGTFLSKEHPEFVISPEKNGGGLLNLGNPAARQFMTKYLAEVIKRYKMDWLRIDYNIDPLPFWQFLDQQDPDRAGMAEIRYVEGFYRMWDDLRATHPHLAIDNCASGGRRIDLETMSRSIPLWRSDNTCDMLDHKPATVVLAAMKNQIMTAGLSRYVPFSTCGQKGSSPYLFRSGMNAGGISFGEDCRPANYPREELKQAIAEAKRLRPYFFGDFYAITPVTVRPDDWCVLQYHRPDKADGMLMAFRREASNEATRVVQLREVDPTATYEVTEASGYERPAARRVKGSELGSLELKIPSKPGSVIVEYKKVAPQE
jgi:alpha-galactosidase